MKKNFIIIGGFLIFILIGVLFTYHYSFTVPKIAVADRCENYVPSWDSFVDCYGVIAITDAWDVDYLSLSDHVHKYEIARVYNQNQYIYTAGKIFVINKETIEGQVSDGVKTQYTQKLFRGGKVTTDYYDSASDIPIYFVVDTTSGEVLAYSNISEVPEDEQGYFKEMENQ